MQNLRDRSPLPEEDPVFDAPWQAKAFSLAVGLHQSGLFAWKEWAELFSKNSREFERDKEVTNNHDYYLIWLNTLEDMLEKKKSLHASEENHPSPVSPGNPSCLHTSSSK